MVKNFFKKNKKPAGIIKDPSKYINRKTKEGRGSDDTDGITGRRIKKVPRP
jgi:hypothetical protein